MYFNEIKKIEFERKLSTKPFSFKFYNPEEIVLGKPMKEHLKFSMAYWHTLTGEGTDPFGSGTMERQWDDTATDAMDQAKVRVEVAFEFMEKWDLSISHSMIEILRLKVTH